MKITEIEKEQVEHKFLDWLRYELDDNEIGINDNFLDIGGNSLIAISLIKRFEESYGRTIEMGKLYKLSLKDCIASTLS